MKKLALALASALPLFATATAFAQPAVTQTQTPATASPVPAPVSAPPAPQTDDWKDVSHINGQVVPVGERGDYLYKDKKLNVSSNPIGWLFGFYGVSASYAVSSNVAIRGDVNYMNIADSNVSGYEIGVSAPIYLKRVYKGPFLEPGIIARGLTDHYDCSYSGDPASCSSDSTHTLVGPEVLFGWHWSFDSGLNAAIAFGAAKNVSSNDSSSDGGVEPAGYFRIGYEF